MDRISQGKWRRQKQPLRIRQQSSTKTKLRGRQTGPLLGFGEVHKGAVGSAKCCREL